MHMRATKQMCRGKQLFSSAVAKKNLNGDNFFLKNLSFNLLKSLNCRDCSKNPLIKQCLLLALKLNILTAYLIKI